MKLELKWDFHLAHNLDKESIETDCKYQIDKKNEQ